MSKIIYTLGTGVRSVKNFFKIIKDNNINIIVDVRRFPTSRFDEFKKENLSRYCIENGVDYIYLGNELGGYRKGGYEEYIKTNEFRIGIERLKEIADNKNICIVCAETLPWKCHRRYIAAQLSVLGYRVVHLIDEKHTWEPKNVSYD